MAPNYRTWASWVSRRFLSPAAPPLPFTYLWQILTLESFRLTAEPCYSAVFKGTKMVMSRSISSRFPAPPPRASAIFALTIPPGCPTAATLDRRWLHKKRQWARTALYRPQHSRRKRRISRDLRRKQPTALAAKLRSPGPTHNAVGWPTNPTQTIHRAPVAGHRGSIGRCWGSSWMTEPSSNHA